MLKPVGLRGDGAASLRRLALTAAALLILSQLLHSRLSQHQIRTTEETAGKLTSWLDAHFQASPVIVFAEAAKKKKKEKSEVVVISVNNPAPKMGHSGYPIYIPTCGGGGGHMGGFGRRKRAAPWA